jgi:2-polyprenyl-3-methyl-5-hydroxy-6-metoxy-1,4-benzoquinol methylase
MTSCPACGSAETKPFGPQIKGSVMTSDFMVLDDAELSPHICHSCGLVFESKGVRGKSEQYYAETFRPKPMMRVFGNGGSLPRPDKALALIEEMFKLPETGSMLEIGAGKGGFLKLFAERHPLWRISALEPSVLFDSIDVQGAELHHGGYEGLDVPAKSFDLIVSLGVIEHVNDPLHLLNWIAKAAKPGAFVFLEAPNFLYHPGDLYCADHLSKLTPGVMQNFAATAGLSMIDKREFGVPMYFGFHNDGHKQPLRSALKQSSIIAADNEYFVFKMDKAFEFARSAAARAGGRFGIYGLGIPGLFAPLRAGYPPEQIASYIDDNEGMWGTTVNGRPINGPAAIKDIRHIALSMSPQYMPAVAAKARAAGATVYMP